MENNSENSHKFQIFAKTSLDSGSTLGYGFIHEGGNRTVETLPQFDFFLPVFITSTSNVYEYIEVTHDDTIFTMERQEVNPFFMEFGFFDGIKRNKTNNGADLTSIMINYIRSVRPDVANLSNTSIKEWFDNIGKYELPWNKGSVNETDLDTLDKISLMTQNIISKANYFNITINK